MIWTIEWSINQDGGISGEAVIGVRTALDPARGNLWYLVVRVGLEACLTVTGVGDGPEHPPIPLSTPHVRIPATDFGGLGEKTRKVGYVGQRVNVKLAVSNLVDAPGFSRNLINNAAFTVQCRSFCGSVRIDPRLFRRPFKRFPEFVPPFPSAVQNESSSYRNSARQPSGGYTQLRIRRASVYLSQFRVSCGGLMPRGVMSNELVA